MMLEVISANSRPLKAVERRVAAGGRARWLMPGLRITGIAKLEVSFRHPR
jgi:hypothetical protein